MTRAPLPAGMPPWKCPRCQRWVRGEAIGRACLRCRFEDHRGADPHCTCDDCIAWAEGSHEFSPKEAT